MILNESKMGGSAGIEVCLEDSDASDFSEGYDSDDALREMLHQNKLKPGLNVIEKVARPIANDSKRLNESIELVMLKAPWLERMDLVNDLAPLTPELAIQIEKQNQKRENQFKGNHKIPHVTPETDPFLNDFEREVLFHRQAQAATIEGMRRLHELSIMTKRPNDYFAEMAKSDDHMRRITKVLQDKETGIAKSERARQLREQRRLGKLIQRQATEKRDEERRKMLDDVKKFRKGKLSNLDFLDAGDDEGPRGEFRKSSKPKLSKKASKKQMNEKRKARDAKFGFGGRKKGMKRNTRQSCVDDRPRKNHSAGGKGRAAKNRPGKSRRSQAQRNRKK